MAFGRARLQPCHSGPAKCGASAPEGEIALPAGFLLETRNQKLDTRYWELGTRYLVLVLSPLPPYCSQRYNRKRNELPPPSRHEFPSRASLPAAVEPCLPAGGFTARALPLPSQSLRRRLTHPLPTPVAPATGRTPAHDCAAQSSRRDAGATDPWRMPCQPKLQHLWPEAASRPTFPDPTPAAS